MTGQFLNGLGDHNLKAHILTDKGETGLFIVRFHSDSFRIVMKNLEFHFE